MCLIPSSAHGTNAASAVMAGMRVVVVGCRENGDVDVDDLREKIAEHRDALAVLMVTYPSTHGVFEEQITDVCAAVHEAGGQVYVDGANLNALVGLAKPGRFGADVSHLNLHKTFCIPHGGGGPGVGPVAVRAHLAPYLPNHPLHPIAGPQRSRRPGGRPGLGGAVGLGGDPADPVGVHPADGRGGAQARHAGRGAGGELRGRAAGRRTTRCSTPARAAWSRTSASSTCGRSPRQTGVTVDDVAKRLIDYGFHAPTMSFPVAGTLMVEPTESEDLRRAGPVLRRDDRDPRRDRAGRRGRVGPRGQPAAPRPAHRGDARGGVGARRTTAPTAVFPAGPRRPADKYWPPVRRIDGAYGDRNLVCSCPPIERARRGLSRSGAGPRRAAVRQVARR